MIQSAGDGRYFYRSLVIGISAIYRTRKEKPTADSLATFSMRLKPAGLTVCVLKLCPT